MQFIEKKFRGINSIILENEKIRIIILKEFGAKIVSIINKDTNYEFLWQGDSETHAVPDYDSSYVDGDLSGMDDMFPTINECFYPSGPWRGTKIPDHGELWSIPWECEAEGERLHLSTYGVRLPYKFEKWIYFAGHAKIRMDYKVTNLSSFSMDFIWTTHPLLNVDGDSKIVFPECMKNIINTSNYENRLGKVGSIHTWPLTTDKFGNSYDLSTILPKESRVCEKFYNINKLSEGWIKLCHGKRQEELTFRFPVDTVQYVGVWKNQGGLKGQHNVALEPATGSLDDIYVSKTWGEQSTIGPKGNYQWYLEMEIR